MGKYTLKEKFGSCGQGSFWKKNWLLFYTVAGVVVGVAIGLINNYFWKTDALTRYYWGFPGDVILMNSLKCIIIPLIVFSIVTGTATMSANAGKLAAYAMGYYILTTVLAIINGIIAAIIFKPGSGLNKADVTKVKDINTKKTVVDGLLDIIRNCFPRNIIEAAIDQAVSSRDATNTKVNVTYTGGQNTLGLIVFSIAFGYYLGKLVKKGNKDAEQVLKVFSGMNSAIMKMVDLIMLYHPIGLCFLISKKIMDMGPDMGKTWAALGIFIANSLVSLFIHMLIIIPLLYFAFVRKNPFKYMYGVSQALITAFACASSAATMPITLRCVETKCNIDPRVSRFVIPVGATVNMDGTALYEAIAALFIANLNNVTMNFGQIVTIAVTATAASIGAAAVPSAGLITLLIVLGAVGLLQYSTDIALIYTVDWFLDRVRTATNVWGDTVGCACVQKWAGDSLKQSDNEGMDDYVDKVVNENEAYE